jgi:hypothetical protein
MSSPAPILPDGWNYATGFLTAAQERALLEVINTLPFHADPGAALLHYLSNMAPACRDFGLGIRRAQVPQHRGRLIVSKAPQAALVNPRARRLSDRGLN